MSTTPLLSRAQLGLRRPTRVSYSITPQGLTAHYGGPSPWRGQNRSSSAAFRDSTDHARCPSIWRAWQAFHMDDRGWTDIAYNSGVCPHGVRFEGRGDRVRSAANGTNDGNARSYATCYIAGDSDPLTDEAKAAFLDEASRFGTPLKWEHSDWKPTACAGDPIRQWQAHGFVSPVGVHVPGAPAPVLPPSHPTVWMAPLPQPAPWWLHVVYLQRVLRASAAQDMGRGGLTGIGDDGIFGAKTKAGVVNVQRFFGLSVDGIVGRKTWGVIDYIAPR